MSVQEIVHWINDRIKDTEGEVNFLTTGAEKEVRQYFLPQAKERLDTLKEVKGHITFTYGDFDDE